MTSLRRLLASRTRKAILLSALIAVTLGTAAYAYVASLPPHVGPRAAITSSPVEFATELERAEFQQGENMTIKISLKNIGNRTITAKWPAYYSVGDGRIMYFDFDVLDANNTLVYRWTLDKFALQSVLVETLEPGEQLTSAYVWFQMSDVPYTQVPKGTYHIKGITHRFALTVNGQTTSGILLETPTITITIA